MIVIAVISAWMVHALHEPPMAARCPGLWRGAGWLDLDPAGGSSRPRSGWCITACVTCAPQIYCLFVYFLIVLCVTDRCLSFNVMFMCSPNICAFGITNWPPWCNNSYAINSNSSYYVNSNNSYYINSKNLSYHINRSHSYYINSNIRGTLRIPTSVDRDEASQNPDEMSIVIITKYTIDMYNCVYVHTYIYIYIYIYIHIIYIYIYVCVSLSLSLSLSLYIYIYIYTHVYIYIYICMCYTYAYSYIHTLHTYYIKLRVLTEPESRVASGTSHCCTRRTTGPATDGPLRDGRGGQD